MPPKTKTPKQVEVVIGAAKSAKKGRKKSASPVIVTSGDSSDDDNGSLPIVKIELTLSPYHAERPSQLVRRGSCSHNLSKGKRARQTIESDSDGAKDVRSPKKIKDETRSSEPAGGVVKSKGKARDNPVATTSVLLWPDICEVTQAISEFNSPSDFYDDYLLGSYDNLPRLKLGTVIAASEIPGDGQYMLSRIEPFMDNMNISLARNSLNFTRHGRYANPSRIDPNLVSARPGDNSYVTFKDRASDIAIFMSTVIVNESFVTSAKKIGTAGQLKYISGIFHAVEWERACSFFCMAFSVNRLVGHMAYDAINFQTRYETDRGSAITSPEASPSRGSTSGMFNKVHSPVTKVQTSGGRALNCTEHVPVYDARDTTFNFALHLPSIRDMLPVFKGEPPHRNRCSRLS